MEGKDFQHEDVTKGEMLLTCSKGEIRQLAGILAQGPGLQRCAREMQQAFISLVSEDHCEYMKHVISFKNNKNESQPMPLSDRWRVLHISKKKKVQKNIWKR